MRAGIGCLLFAAIGWGLNWPIIKLLLRDWPPLFSRGSAGLLAAAALFAYAALKRDRLGVPAGSWGKLIVLSFTNVFAFMGFSAIALLWLTPGEGALLVYTMPLWATLIAWPIRGARPGARAIMALGLCFAGTLVLFSDSVATLSGDKLPGILLSLAAAVLFALGTVAASETRPMLPVVSTAWQVLLGSVPMVGLSLAFEQPHPARLSGLGFVAWAYMATVPMGLCYLAWFGAVRRLPPIVATTGSLLAPIVGVLASAPILGVALTVQDLVALALTLTGVALVIVRRAKSA
ncbi:drug/metabolite transporter (DMT)-like permease [Methylopila capsulata]|uniref:Transporter n=1 Tax=Methylopila capsulata TaxID=61654 RepID=A0A9W6IUF7_9HYPH|nr:DMT family transporter [Methylopila capsulata]MBM7852202.1 drug/metabolite transporter (DMT)-like permease [Methylopila capsulata]GLK56408.1 transporter [Methylopila capsulata]